MGFRGVFFLVGGTVCLLVQSPMIFLIAAVTMTAFNRKKYNIHSILQAKKSET